VKFITAVGWAVVFAACGLAQQSHSFSSVHFGNVQFGAPRSAPAPRTFSSGFGTFAPPIGASRLVLPATGIMPLATGISDMTFASRLGATVSGSGFPGQRHGYHRFRQGAIVVPYAYPVYVGGYYPDSGYGYAGQEAPAAYPPQPAPPVVINEGFLPDRAAPVIREYGQGEDTSGPVQIYEGPTREPIESAEEDSTNYYLIAFKDHSIYSAFAYWVEGDTLHYVTPQRVHNQASLSLVDRELTDKLNRDRPMQVKLPK